MTDDNVISYDAEKQKRQLRQLPAILVEDKHIIEISEYFDSTGALDLDAIWQAVEKLPPLPVA